MNDSELQSVFKATRGLDAYYFSFESTGVEAIDRVLWAIAYAGKAYHHTNGWKDELSGLGLSSEELIQKAADMAAREIGTT